MHQSDEPNRLTLIIQVYLDESGTDDQNPHAVVAGLVMERDNFILFDFVWNSILSKYKIEPPLHMKEFGKHGRLGYIDYPTRYELFTELAGAINSHKIYSVAVSLEHEQYNELLSIKTKKEVSIYGLSFMLCAYQCFAMATFNYYCGDIVFLMEEGNEHCGNVRRAHRGMMQMKKEGATGIMGGSLTFHPKNLSPLQAADVIAWGVRRKISGELLGKGFQPISNIFDVKHHVQNKYNNQLLEFIETHSGNK